MDIQSIIIIIIIVGFVVGCVVLGLNPTLLIAALDAIQGLPAEDSVYIIITIIFAGFVVLLLRPTAPSPATVDAIQGLPEDSVLPMSEAWDQLSREIGGEFSRDESGPLTISHRVVAQVKEWTTITLDLFHKGLNASQDKPYTRITAPFMNKDGFWFAIHSKTSFSKLRELVGMQDIKVRYPDFDPNFTIRTNSVPKMRSLLANPKIRELILAQPHIYLKSSGGMGFDVLHFEELGIMTDLQRLKSLFALFAETLNQLVHMGSASEERPIIPPVEPAIVPF